MKKVLGIGNALVDIMTILDSDKFLTQLEIQKGSMQLVDSDLSSEILKLSEQFKREISSGGSAANTIHGLANLGTPTTFIGKTGDDVYGKFFSDDMRNNGIDPLLLTGLSDTGRAIALISPDSERTFATYLGASVELSHEDLSTEMFLQFDYLYIEGYLVQNHKLVEKILEFANQHPCKICLDLASYNVVEQNLDFLKKVMSDYVDIVFANEEEAKAFTGLEPEKALDVLAGICGIAVVKVGHKGSLVKQGNNLYRIEPRESKCIDTTGAGDAYAAGFIYGLANDLPLEKCGEIGSLLAGKVIEVIGAKMDQSIWAEIKELLPLSRK
ncbi:MAG TPA: adenosine kinase [Bacteroidales bacterium]|nr:adenosine kinase [Bacteroidales bacterium]